MDRGPSRSQRKDGHPWNGRLRVLSFSRPEAAQGPDEEGQGQQKGQDVGGCLRKAQPGQPPQARQQQDRRKKAEALSGCCDKCCRKGFAERLQQHVGHGDDAMEEEDRALCPQHDGTDADDLCVRTEQPDQARRENGGRD